MLQAISEGTTDAQVLANLARGLLGKNLPQLQEALDGRVQPHQRILLKHILAHVAFVEQALEQLQHEREQRLPPFEEEMDLLMSMPGFQAPSAAAMLAEIGADLSRFPKASHLARLRRSLPFEQAQRGQATRDGKTRKGNATLRAALAEVVWVIAHTTDHDLAAQYHRLARRIGKHQAAMAVAHSVLVSLYHVLHARKPSSDVGADDLQKQDANRVAQRSLRQLEALGYEVTLPPKVAEFSARV